MLERARQVWERVLAVEPTHVGAAPALAPIYAKQEKWARLITVLEIELAAAPDVAGAAREDRADPPAVRAEARVAHRSRSRGRCARSISIRRATRCTRTCCGSRTSPSSGARSRPRSSAQLARGRELDDTTRLKLLRELAKIASRRLADPERARGYHRQVLALAPEDREAEQHLEELRSSSPTGRSCSRRTAGARRARRMPTERASLLIEIASLQEEKLVDLDGAAATYREALDVAAGQLRALRALARIEEARGDWEALAEVLAERARADARWPGRGSSC